MAALKVLITGATGYIGGSILSQLLKSNIFPSSSISVLVRGENKASTLRKLGVNVILFNGLDEAELLQRVASQHDLVIHTASGFHAVSAKALVLGLGDRKKVTGKQVHYLHTTGTSNLGDQPITGKYSETRIFSDKENIFAYEKSREAQQIYAQRTTDIVVVETGLKVGVSTTLIMSPTIYGVGSGLFNKLSIQVPILIRAAIDYGYAVKIGEGQGVWDYVHISDLADLYELLVKRIVAGEPIPTGEQGILFSTSGRFTWAELSQGVADALTKLGAIKSSEVQSINLTTATEKFGIPALLNTELGFSSNSRTQSVVGKDMGWNPVKTESDFKNHFLEEATLVLA